MGSAAALCLTGRSSGAYTGCSPALFACRSVVLPFLLFFTVFLPGWGAEADAWLPVGESSAESPLREAAAGLQRIGTVLGATYHADRGMLVIWGNGQNCEASPTLQQVAVALKWAFADKPDGHFVSIDPLDGDPYAPWMSVDISEDAADTDFGWIMFEADRLLKCLSLGEDNVLGYSTTSDVPGFRSLRDLVMARDGAGQQPVWSRFWLYPRSSVMEVSGRGMVIREAAVGVRTEKMVLTGGKLTRVKGVSDPDADRFAAFFTTHYDAFAEEFPVFRRLENSLRLLMVSEWVRREGIPLTLDWVYRAAEAPYRLPRATPALHVAASRRTRTGNRVTTRTIRLFGGADLDVDPDCVTGGERLRGFQQDADLHVPDGIGTTGRYTGADGEVRGVAFTAGESAPGKVTELTRVALPDGAKISLAVRPAAVRSGRGVLAGDSELALPHLCAHLPKAREGSVESFGVRGRNDTLVPVRRYQVFSADGSLAGTFEQHDIDQQRGEVVLRASGKGGEWRLYPTTDGAAYVVGPDGIVWIFDVKSGAVVGQQIHGQLLRYTYTPSGELQEIRCGDRWIRMTTGCNGTRTLGYETSDGKRAGAAPGTEGGRQRTVVAHNEIGQQAEVFLDLRTGDMTPPDAVPGQDFLARQGLDVAKVVSESAETMVLGRLFGDEGTAVLALGHSVRQLPVPADGLKHAMARLCNNPARCPQRILDVLKPLVQEKDGGGPIVIEDRDPTTRQGLGLAAHHAGADEVFTTADADQARKHLGELGARRTLSRAVDVRVLGDTLEDRPGIRSAFEELAEQSGESDLVVVMGHRTQGLADRIRALAPSLTGKFVVFMICGDVTSATPSDADLYESLLRDHGVVGLVGYDHMIDAGHAAAVVRRMQEVGRAGDVERTAVEVYRKALSDCAAGQRAHREDPGEQGEPSREEAPESEQEPPAGRPFQRMQRQPCQVQVMPHRHEIRATAA